MLCILNLEWYLDVFSYGFTSSGFDQKFMIHNSPLKFRTFWLNKILQILERERERKKKRKTKAAIAKVEKPQWIHTLGKQSSQMLYNSINLLVNYKIKFGLFLVVARWNGFEFRRHDSNTCEVVFPFFDRIKMKRQTRRTKKRRVVLWSNKHIMENRTQFVYLNSENSMTTNFIWIYWKYLLEFRLNFEIQKFQIDKKWNSHTI